MKSMKILAVVTPNWPILRLMPDLSPHIVSTATSYEKYIELNNYKFDLLALQFTPFTP